eukprot:TRINITY_DN20200_c0_g1_i11.p1 TRINITY_DN20200_c0_g1~~TRINITY_DN20200_c0_g1_i11.p1  ORF type:complete len:128 (+),score=8.52 TRINITY_DN20200_c0_g1_i11:39-386(+)
MAFPDWYKQDDEQCWIAYCNAYEDVRKQLCCYGKKDSKGYCLNDNLCTGKAGEALGCRTNLINSGIRKKRLESDKRHLFPPKCGGTMAFPDWYKQDDEQCWIAYCNAYEDLRKAL